MGDTLYVSQEASSDSPADVQKEDTQDSSEGITEEDGSEGGVRVGAKQPWHHLMPSAQKLGKPMPLLPIQDLLVVGGSSIFSWSVSVSRGMGVTATVNCQSYSLSIASGLRAFSPVPPA